MNIQNLLIDLGGVLYEIDISRTLERLRSLQVVDNHLLVYQGQADTQWFSQLDQGKIDIEAFAIGLQRMGNLQASLADIQNIWKELLIGVFPGRYEAISHLAKRYRLALLSNTSRFHYNHYIDACRPMFDQMDHLFFSFEMGLTKPDVAIYEQALAQTGWKASETLFLDDSHVNIEAARSVGLQTAWIETPAHFDTTVAELLA